MNATRTEVRILTTVFATLILIACAVYPVMALEKSGSSVPVVLGLWEEDLSPVLEDGDTLHSVSGSQFLPPCAAGAEKKILLYAIIGSSTVNNPFLSVEAEVSSPGSSHKHTVDLTQLPPAEGSFVARRAAAVNLVTLSPSATYQDVITKLGENTAAVWKGELTLTGTQNAGEYSVTVTSSPETARSELRTNSFAYIPIACMEFDFSSVDYGSSTIDEEKWIEGDAVFGTSDKPSVRNIGNSPARVRLAQDDMGFGKTTDAAWNIEYKARIADNTSVTSYGPGNPVLLADAVSPGEVVPIDFSMSVAKGSGMHSGAMTLGYEQVDVPLNSLEQDRSPYGEEWGNKAGVSSVMIPEFPRYAGISQIVEDYLRIFLQHG